jgi:hypothetical protein
MGHGTRVKKSFAVAFILVIMLAVAPALVLAAEADKKDNRPERGIAVYTDYSGVAVARWSHPLKSPGPLKRRIVCVVDEWCVGMRISNN